MAETYFVEGLIFLRLDNRREPTPHPWVIVSDPIKDPERVVLVSLTDGEKWYDPACEFHAGEHVAITKKSRAAYLLAEVMTLDRLRETRENGQIAPLGRLPAPLLKRIRMGVWESTDVSWEIMDLLEDQGLARDDL